MVYKEELEKRAKQSFDKLMNYIDEQANLLVNEDEEDNMTMIEVTYWGEQEEDLVGRFYFNDDGEFIKVEE